jgi:hypothetical protein
MNKWMDKYKILVFVGLCVLAAAATYGFKEYSRKVPDTHELTAAFQIDAVDLVNKFDADAFAATDQYADKVIEVRGFVGSIHLTDTSGTVLLKAGTSISSVVCQVDKKNLGEIKQLHHGEMVIIKGICSGYLMDVIMVRCILVDKLPVFPLSSSFFISALNAEWSLVTEAVLDDAF